MNEVCGKGHALTGKNKWVITLIRCRRCYTEWNHAYYLKHRETVLGKHKVWRDKNKEKRLVDQREYRAKYPAPYGDKK